MGVLCIDRFSGNNKMLEQIKVEINTFIITKLKIYYAGKKKYINMFFKRKQVYNVVLEN